jgi:hypothetical protein
MSSLEIITFSLKSAWHTPLNILIAILAGIGGYTLLLFFRWSINKKWGGCMLVMIVVALAFVILTFSYRGLLGAHSYIERQKVSELNVLRDDAVWRNEALARAWTQLSIVGKQRDLIPPEEGGTEIRLHSKEDSQIYAQQVAQAMEDHLRELPHTPPTVEFQTKEDIAIQVVEGNSEIQMMNYPQLVSQDNSIANEILEIRVDEVFSASTNGVEARSAQLKKSIYILLSLIGLAGILAVTTRAWVDLLKTN